MPLEMIFLEEKVIVCMIELMNEKIVILELEHLSGNDSHHTIIL